MDRFTNKIVVITGGTSGIGLAAARQFIKEGANVVVTGRNPQSITDVQKELGVKGLAIAADVTKSAELDSLFRRVREKYGRIDVLYANAGIAKLGSVAETSEQVFDDVLDTNFRGAYFTVQKALPLLSNGGAIVFTSSWFAEAGVAGTSAVSASKAALRNLTRTLASELIAGTSASMPSAQA
jgi:NAD(P)-dependent dehydrogenase (short-subunit alcohol dehydrogenase family)